MPVNICLDSLQVDRGTSDIFSGLEHVNKELFKDNRRNAHQQVILISDNLSPNKVFIIFINK